VQKSFQLSFLIFAITFKNVTAMEEHPKKDASVGDVIIASTVLALGALAELGNEANKQRAAKKKLKANYKAKQKKDPFYNAITTGDVDAFDTLIKEHKDIFIRDKFGNTCLHWVASATFYKHNLKGLIEIMIKLINMGIDINICNDKGTTALHKASARHNAQMIAILVANGSMINARNNKQRTPLFSAICKVVDYNEKSTSTISAIKTLIQLGANPYIEGQGRLFDDRHSTTPMGRVLFQGFYHTMENLLELGVNLDEPIGSLGWTLLHTAASGDNETVARKLLEYGASVNTKTFNGETPLDLLYNFHSFSIDHSRTRTILIDAGGQRSSKCLIM